MKDKILVSRIIQLAVPCSDNGKRFVSTERLDLIRTALAGSQYECLADLPLAKIYCHRHFQKDNPIVLVSCHIDSIYNQYFTVSKDGYLQGTFDNAVGNAITVEAMLRGFFSAQVLVSFTGNEEKQCRGADQTISFLLKKKIYDSLEMVVTLDLTEEHYRSQHFTIENGFVKQKQKDSLLRFDDESNLRGYLSTILDFPVFVEEAVPDESWRYDAYDLNCFSFCLPCRVLGADMHADHGVEIWEESVERYMAALRQLMHRITKDLACKSLQRKVKGR